MNVLSIETSCDETAAAIIHWSDNQATVLANTVSSQASLHAKWGGVVPDLASREHIKNIVPVIQETLERARLSPDDIDLLAVTQGPGLMPALVVGVTAAKTLAYLWKKPLIGIHHLEGHIYANFIQTSSATHIPEAKEIFPLIALIVSGGHTELVLMNDHFQYEILGETQDDAAGEAFDKVAKMLGLDYPGGPLVAKKADAFREQNKKVLMTDDSSCPNEITEKSTFTFPRPMIDSDDFNFSFSGLKTSVLYFLKKHEAQKQEAVFINQVCHEFQEAVVDVLVAKTKKALTLYAPTTFVIAGGVSANVRLRARLSGLIKTINSGSTAVNDKTEKIVSKPKKIQFLTPEFSYSLDNAAMIAIAAALRYEHMDPDQRASLLHLNSLTPAKNAERSFVGWLEPDANMPFQNLTSIPKLK